MNLHPYQLKILKKLMYNPKLKFSDLQIDGLSSKHFNYHLKKLVELKLLRKQEIGYVLTNMGKDYVSKLDERDMKLEKQPKVSVALIVTRDGKDELEYLVTKRLKQPYYGKLGGFTGKVRFGEKFSEAAKRELMEETGLTGSLEFAHIHHKLAHSPDDKEIYIQDNIFVIYSVTNVKGELVEKNEEQENFWMGKEKLFSHPDLFKTFPHIARYAELKNKGLD